MVLCEHCCASFLTNYIFTIVLIMALNDLALNDFAMNRPLTGLASPVGLGEIPRNFLEANLAYIVNLVWHNNALKLNLYTLTIIENKK